MKTKYKFIQFIFVDKTEKTSIWNCYNLKSGDRIGRVKWYCTWRQYCFLPENETVYSRGCLCDINNFIEQLMDDRK